jgi:hypothetical protein
MDNVEEIDPSLRSLERPLLLMNHAGHFEVGDMGGVPRVAGRGAAFGDINGDGWTDVVMTVLGGHPMVFRNRGGAAHWLTIRLRGTKSNRDGLGAVVRANGQTQYAQTAGSYQSASDKRVHFGLSEQSKADVEVDWPSGVRQLLRNVAADRFMTITEPEAK